MIPVQLPSPVVCVLTTRSLAGLDVEHVMWVAAFTDVDPLGEQPADDGDGLPLIVTDYGLRTPAQHAAEAGVELVSWRIAWPQQQGSGLVIANGVPRLN